ncbi:MULTISPECIES: SDR family oxidoreductase [Priestia]|jgi:gluconate 5-dehydrogenase|uniref:glucose 1-dehydrogenase [NAD(P)(+)] n=3 Tax=Priestia TaxID=2800373 RepID=D5DS14_PRIM1|nr:MULTISPECIES: SDR family oxidoreductase [Priestia]KOP74540.1 gluconate 5-dehydrogenase [Bacillus sp. FJAT-21351]KQU19800.1 gluconate 5-dehydrogenase [Bacillus sp. Leaf75]KRF55837.1 gluconate 5-dehydrogenase [Bacillus sp. Soil531]MCF6796231.1 SDR family oxidoreductase [Bacillus sp. ET1]MDH6654655.1 gluconate 5-dehydrogenase [Bacillus sp. PvP124]MDP9575207.1 gluconate 5-dehydrogenase [Bacillus sp. 1751]RFB29682.1 SDR family oxidoreductase [Bacillus sp. ALD]RFB40915.1 SDR family oxidoreduct
MHIKDLFDLTGKTAIITGGGRGLGEQMAEGLAEAGANIVLCSRKKEACQQVADRLATTGVKTLALACDISQPEDIKNVVHQTIEKFGRIDILINNSGATWGAPVEEMPLEAWQKVMNINVTGTFLMSQEAGKEMIKQKAGKIINIASIAGLGGTDPQYMDTIGYNTSKGAVITFTKDLAVKWGQHNIQVNAIAPGFFPTKMSGAIMEQGKDYFLSQTPLKRFGSEADLKGAAVFLASAASNYITGDILTVDGGVHAM